MLSRKQDLKTKSQELAHQSPESFSGRSPLQSPGRSPLSPGSIFYFYVLPVLDTAVQSLCCAKISAPFLSSLHSKLKDANKSAANRASLSRHAGEPTLSGYNTRSQKKKARDESTENYDEPSQQPEGMKKIITTRSRAHIQQQQLEVQGVSSRDRDYPKGEEDSERRAVALWLPVSSLRHLFSFMRVCVRACVCHNVPYTFLL